MSYRGKSINKEWYRLLKKLLENTPGIDNLDMGELYLVVDGKSHILWVFPESSEDMFNHEHYVEWQREFDKLVTYTRIAYKSYRAAVRETLYL